MSKAEPFNAEAGVNITDEDSLISHADILALANCPFCGGGSLSLKANGRYWTGQRWSDPVSVSIYHNCQRPDGQPSSPRVERVGKDVQAAIKAWNFRAGEASAYARGRADMASEATEDFAK